MTDARRTPTADPLPAARPRDPGDPARDSARPRRQQAVFSYWRTTVPEWQEANDQIEALWQQHPEGSSQLVLDEPRASRARPTCSSAATSSSPARPVDAGRARVPASAARRTRPPTRLTFARWLVDRSSPTTARVDRQPRLAGLLRHRPRRAPARTSARRASRRRIRSCSTGWPSSSWISGWSLKTLHRLIVDFGDLPAVVARHAGAARARPLQPAARPRPAVPRRGRDRPRHRAGGQRPAESRRSAGPSVYPPAPRVPVPAAGQLRPEDLGRGHRAPTAIAARSTRSATARCPIPVLQTFDAPNGDFSCVRRVALEHAAAGADHAERAALPRVPRGPWRCATLARRRHDRRRPRRLRLPPRAGPPAHAPRRAARS